MKEAFFLKSTSNPSRTKILTKKTLTRLPKFSRWQWPKSEVLWREGFYPSQVECLRSLRPCLPPGKWELATSSCHWWPTSPWSGHKLQRPLLYIHVSWNGAFFTGPERPATSSPEKSLGSPSLYLPKYLWCALIRMPVNCVQFHDSMCSSSGVLLCYKL